MFLPIKLVKSWEGEGNLVPPTKFSKGKPCFHFMKENVVMVEEKMCQFTRANKGSKKLNFH